MSESKDLRHIQLTVDGKNETLSGYINMSLNGEATKPYDEVGAAYYVIAVVLVYGLSMVLLIGSLAKKNMKNNAAEHDERQVSRYLEKVPSLKELSARQQFKELKSNIIRVVSNKTPLEDLSKMNNSSVSDERDVASPPPGGLGSKKVSFSSESGGHGRKYSGERSPKIYIGSREVLNASDASASENSPLLGRHNQSSLTGYSPPKERRGSSSRLLDSDSEVDSPVMKPKLKHKSSWGETRVYEKTYNKTGSYYYDVSSDGSPALPRRQSQPEYRSSHAYYQYTSSDVASTSQQNPYSGGKKAYLAETRTSEGTKKAYVTESKLDVNGKQAYLAETRSGDTPLCSSSPYPESRQTMPLDQGYRIPSSSYYADGRSSGPFGQMYTGYDRNRQGNAVVSLSQENETILPPKHAPAINKTRRNNFDIPRREQHQPDNHHDYSSQPRRELHQPYNHHDFSSQPRREQHQPDNHHNFSSQPRSKQHQPDNHHNFSSKAQSHVGHSVTTAQVNGGGNKGGYFYCKYCDNRDGKPALCSYAIDQCNVAICHSDENDDKVHVTTL